MTTEIRACAGRIEWPDGQHLWIEASTSRAFLHASYTDDEPQSGTWYGVLPVTVFPTGKPQYRLHLPGLAIDSPRSSEAPVLSLQLWEIRDGEMWRWAFPEWRPQRSEVDTGVIGPLASGQHDWVYRGERVDAIAPVSMAT